jgi:hypothetical protein
MKTKTFHALISGALTLAVCTPGAPAAPQPTWHLRLNPGGREGHSAVYDPTSNRLIVFGGNTAFTAQFHLNDLWLLNDANATGNSQSWTSVTTGTVSAPSPRVGHSAVYNASMNKMIVFGGAGGYASPCYNDLWVLSNANGDGGTPTWNNLSPNGTPPAARFEHTAVYNATTDTMVVFGGSSCEADTVYNDTWWLINASGTNGTPQWIQITPSSPPTARAGHSAVYDAATDEMIVYGGYEANGTTLLDIATLANATHTESAWSDDVLSGPALALHSAVYDSKSDRMIVFGGYSSGGGEWNSEIWILVNASGGIRSWVPVFPSPNADPTLGQTAAYDSAHNRMIVYGGEMEVGSNTFWSDDVMVLTDANGLPSYQ